MSIKQEIKKEYDEESLGSKPEYYVCQSNIALPEKITVKEECWVQNEQNNDTRDSLLSRPEKNINELLNNEINDHAMQPVVKIKIEPAEVTGENWENPNEPSSVDDNTLCEKEAESSDEKSETAENSKNNGPHKCTECNYCTSSKKDLTRHVRIEHEHADTYSCESCDFTTVHRGSLKIHTRTHSNIKPFRCKFCPDKYFVIKCSLIKHMKKNHPEKPPEEFETYQCEQCSFETVNAFTFETHKCKFGRSRKCTCPTCGHVSFSERDFRKHFAIHTALKCDHCEFSCKLKVELRQHIKKDHPEVMFKCSKCEYTTCVMYYLKVHEKSHEDQSDQKHICPICNYSTDRRNVLKEHMLMHNKNKTFSCPHCEYTTTRSVYLKKHIQIRHQIRLSEEKLKCPSCQFSTFYKYNFKMHLMKHMKKTENSTKLKCSSCDYSTYYKSSLKRHALKHTENFTKFECASCDFSTYYKYNLKMHALKHTKETENSTKFECSFCDYSTYYKFSLKKHLVRHSGEKPFPCKHCKYSAKSEEVLKSHVMKRHSEGVIKTEAAIKTEDENYVL